VVVLNAGHKSESVTMNLKGVVPEGAPLVEEWTAQRLEGTLGKFTLTAEPLSGSVWTIG